MTTITDTSTHRLVVHAIGGRRIPVTPGSYWGGREDGQPYICAYCGRASSTSDGCWVVATTPRPRRSGNLIAASDVVLAHIDCVPEGMGTVAG